MLSMQQAQYACSLRNGSREPFFFLLTILYYLSASHFRALTYEVPTGPPAARARAFAHSQRAALTHGSRHRYSGRIALTMRSGSTGFVLARA